MQQNHDSSPVQQFNIPPQIDIPVQYLTKSIIFTFIVSLSTLHYGYSLTLISASSMTLLIQYYSIPLSQTVISALLNGVLPFGGIFGALITPKVAPLASKRVIHYWLCGITIIICGIGVIPTTQTVMIGRFLLGATSSIYLSISGGYIKQSFPPFMRKYLGAIYSCGITLGILICYLIATISSYSIDDTEHIIVFFGPAYISIIQAVLVKLYLPDTVIELLNKNRNEAARQVLSYLYSQQNVQLRMKQIMREISQSNRRTIVYQSMVFLNRKNLASIHLAILRHFCGMSYIIVYAGQIVDGFGGNPSTAPVSINSIQLAANIVGIFLVQKLKRNTVLNISCWLMGVINLIIGIADIQKYSKFCITMMCIFMIPCGAGLNSIVYALPSELVAASQGKYSSAFSWLAGAMVGVIPPFVSSAVPGNYAFPMFFFFALYLSVVSFINLKLLPDTYRVDSKRKVYELKQIILRQVEQNKQNDHI